MMLIDLKQIDSDQNIFVLKKTRKSCERLEHGPFTFDENMNYVECDTCKEHLHPMAVIKILSNSEHQIWRRRLESQKLIKKAEDKNRTKCEHCKKMTSIVK